MTVVVGPRTVPVPAEAANMLVGAAEYNLAVPAVDTAVGPLRADPALAVRMEEREVLL